VKTCSYCGRENADDATFCRECGTGFVGTPPKTEGSAPWEQIAVLGHEIEAERLAAELDQRAIPHVLTCYSDPVVSSLFQVSHGWGHVEAPAEHKDAVLSILRELRQRDSESEMSAVGDPDVNDPWGGRQQPPPLPGVRLGGDGGAPHATGLPGRVPGSQLRFDRRENASAKERLSLILVRLAIAAGLCLITLIGLRLAGLIMLLHFPTSGMASAIEAHDRVLMERFSYLARRPERGDIIVFRTDAISSLPPHTTYAKRIAGLPGDILRIADGKLYVNEKHLPLRNRQGEIRYAFSPRSHFLKAAHDTVTVPEAHYFVLGDNSTNSYDSRHWGFVPQRAIRGRIVFCYWPPSRIGVVR